VLATGRFATDSNGYRLMLKYVRDQWPHRRCAIEGAQGVGRPPAQRLLAQGENVLDVPAKLAARARIFDTGKPGLYKKSCRSRGPRLASPA
jgi:transposase